MTITAKIKSATEKILNTDLPGLWKEGTDELYEIFSAQTKVYAGDLTFETFAKAQDGLVVSPVMAAHCLIDFVRTAHFLRGIHQAIKDQLKKNKPVNILYAGCGPYATLITPLTSQFSADEVSVTMLEFDEKSLQLAKNMYEELGLTDYVKAYLHKDATDPDIEFQESFDIILSETMQTALKKECQVPLTRNLVRFLKPEGTFIPQNVKVEAALEHPRNKQEPDILPIGSIYELDYLNVPEKNHQTTLVIPDTPYELLTARTTIQTYEDEWIWEDGTSLTYKLVMDRIEGCNRKCATFTYNEAPKEGEEIGFKLSYEK